MEQFNLKKSLKAFLKKTKKGFLVSLKSLQFIFQHRKLLFFPMLVVGIGLVCFALYELLVYYVWGVHSIDLFRAHDEASKASAKMYIYGLLTVGYFVLAFILGFVNVGLAYATAKLLKKEQPSLWESIKVSFSKIKVIFFWACAAFVVHMIVSVTKSESERRSGWMVETAGAIIGLAWAVLTFLFIPVVAYERLGMLQSIKRSAELIRKSLGESLGAALSFTGMIILVLLAALGCFFSALFLLARLHISGTALGGVLMLIILATLVLLAIISAAGTVFKTAVYNYALEQPTGFFSEADIQESFTYSAVHVDVLVSKSGEPETVWTTLRDILSYAGILTLLNKMGKGIKLGLLSLKALFYHKKLLFFPVVSALLLSVGLVLFLLGFLLLLHFKPSTCWVVGEVILLYLCIAVISLFFNTCLAHATHTLFEGGEISLGKSLWATMKRLNVIIPWGIIAIVLKGSSSEEKSVVSTTGNFFSFLMSAGWSMLSFFIYPVIACERLGLVQSAKRSFSLMKDYFGQAIGMTLGTFFISKILLIILLFFILGLNLLVQLLHDATVYTIIGVFFSALFLLFFMFLTASSFLGAARTVFSVVVYHYVLGLPTGSFSKELLDSSLQLKKEKA